MKLFRNLIFTTLVLAAGRVVAFPIEVTELTNGNGQVIYNIKDLHFSGNLDEENAQFVVELAKKFNAIVLVETANQDGEGGTSTFLESTYQYCKNAGIDTKNIEIRPKEMRIADIDFHGEDVTKTNEAYSKLFKEFEEKVQKLPEHGTLPGILKNTLQTIKKTFPILTEVKLDSHWTENAKLWEKVNEACDYFVDMQIMLEVTSSSKNFIICSGATHGNSIDSLHQKRGFRPGILCPRQRTEIYPYNTECSLRDRLGIFFGLQRAPQITPRITPPPSPTLKNLLLAGGTLTLIAATKAYGPRLWNWIKSKF